MSRPSGLHADLLYILFLKKQVSAILLNDQDTVDIGETRFQFVDLVNGPSESAA